MSKEKDKNKGKELEVLDFDNMDIKLIEDNENDTLWGTVKQIAEIFDSSKRNIHDHIKNILSEGELDIRAMRNFRIAQKEGNRIVKKNINHYNLDMMIAVGYRVSSKRGTQFRIWSTEKLRTLLRKGITVVENKVKTEDLANVLRKLRNEEKHFYGKIKDILKKSAADYDDIPESKKRSFFAFIQDKFLFAITGKTASQIKLERVDSTKDNMGLQNFTGNVPTYKDCSIAKNYLKSNELERLEHACESLIVIIGSHACEGKQLTIDELDSKINLLLEILGYKVFKEYPRINSKKVDNLVKIELDKYKKLKLGNNKK